MTLANWAAERMARPIIRDDEPPAEFDADPLADLCRSLLVEIGENPDREGLADTPRRWAAWWREFTDYDPGTVSTAFASVASDQLVVVGGMRVWSLCEHHLLPFNAEISIAYVPADRVLGLSKFGRIAQDHAHRLQVQERLCAGIADDIAELCGTEDVAVVARGEHLCMTMRGIRTPARMTTSVMRGVFRTKPEARAEALGLMGNG